MPRHMPRRMCITTAIVWRGKMSQNGCVTNMLRVVYQAGRQCRQQEKMCVWALWAMGARAEWQGRQCGKGKGVWWACKAKGTVTMHAGSRHPGRQAKAGRQGAGVSAGKGRSKAQAGVQAGQGAQRKRRWQKMQGAGKGRENQGMAEQGMQCMQGRKCTRQKNPTTGQTGRRHGGGKVPCHPFSFLQTVGKVISGCCCHLLLPPRESKEIQPSHSTPRILRDLDRRPYEILLLFLKIER